MAVKAKAEITLATIRDVQSVTRYYLLQSSTSSIPSKPTVNPPGGSWVKTEPSYTSGSTNSLYFTDLTVFTDGSFSYSDVSLCSRTVLFLTATCPCQVPMKPRRLPTTGQLRQKGQPILHFQKRSNILWGHRQLPRERGQGSPGKQLLQKVRPLPINSRTREAEMLLSN